MSCIYLNHTAYSGLRAGIWAIAEGVDECALAHTAVPEQYDLVGAVHVNADLQ